MPDVRLLVDGVLYGGWLRIRIQRSMEQAAGQFELGVTERWEGQDTPRPIAPGAECKVLVDGAPVITGHVDDVRISYDGGEHSVDVSGRDATGDLVDCSAPSTQFSGRTLAEVARDLCRPFGVGVTVAADVGGAFTRLKNNEGDSVFETLEAAARVRAVLLLSDGLGNLVLARAGTGRVATVLALGENVTSCRGDFSLRDRFSEILVKGQTHGTDTWNGEASAQPLGAARDSRVPRRRPLTVLAEENIDPAAAQTRAEWEVSVRFGRSRRITYTTPGWSHAGGLWTPNTLVPVRDAYLGLDCDLLLAEVVLLLDGQGARAELTLCPAEAFRLIPVPEPDTDGGLL